MISTLAGIGLAAAFVAVLPAVSAQAQSPRTFVSAAGSDSNPCSFAAPCRHFQAAVNATSAGGEVDALDPAGYGPIIISRAVTIEGQGWSYIAPPANSPAITINAVGATDKISIHGVSLNGVGITGSTTGIQFNSGGSLKVRDCVIQNFSGDGIDFKPTAAGDLFVSNTVVSDNGDTGIAVFPAGNNNTTAHTVIFNRVETNNNFKYGVFLWGTPSTGSITATVSESTASGNGSYGFYVLTAQNRSPTSLMLFHSVAAGNNVGIYADGIGATTAAAQSVLSGGGLFAWEAENGATPYTFGNNYIPPGTAGPGGEHFSNLPPF